MLNIGLCFFTVAYNIDSLLQISKINYRQNQKDLTLEQPKYSYGL